MSASTTPSTALRAQMPTLSRQMHASMLHHLSHTPLRCLGRDMISWGRLRHAAGSTGHTRKLAMQVAAGDAGEGGLRDSKSAAVQVQTAEEPEASGNGHSESEDVGFEEPSTSDMDAEEAAEPGAGAVHSAWLDDPAIVRRITALKTANEVLDLVLKEVDEVGISDEDCRRLIIASLERGNAALALSIYDAMCSAGPGGSMSMSSSSMAGDELGGGGGGALWPAASLGTVSAVVLGLARVLRLKDAIRVVEDTRRRGVPRGEEVPFGFVVNSPLAPDNPLAVVQPQEGAKLLPCAATRYQFELFSGQVVSTSSEALTGEQSLLLGVLRALRLWRKPAVGAVHQMVVQAPDNRSRTFRFATETAEVPAQVSNRVTVVCAPGRDAPQPAGLLSASPPFCKPGEPLSVANHVTGVESRVFSPPASQAGLPSWALPATVILAGSDAASALIDPNLPALAAGAVGLVVVSGVLGNSVLLPRLKQLPEAAIKVEATRQRLLAQHNALVRNVAELVEGASEDVRMLARLWQLQNKMESVGQPGAYDARKGRVAKAREALESRLTEKLGLIDGYARVMNMIEIEVEMETEVPAAEVSDIEAQIAALGDVQQLQTDWRYQAEAQDEVERLLRAI